MMFSNRFQLCAQFNGSTLNRFNWNISQQYSYISFYTMLNTIVKHKYFDDNNFVCTGCTGCYHDDNLWSSQWWQGCHIENLFISMHSLQIHIYIHMLVQIWRQAQCLLYLNCMVHCRCTAIKVQYLLDALTYNHPRHFCQFLSLAFNGGSHWWSIHNWSSSIKIIGCKE